MRTEVTSSHRIFLSYHGGLDAHDGDPAAADNRYRAAQVVADQIAHGVPEACFTDLPAAVADEPDQRPWEVLSQALYKSSIHVVLISDDLGDDRKATRCHWVGAAIMKAIEEGTPQVGVYIHGIPTADGRLGARGPTRSGTSPRSCSNRLCRCRVTTMSPSTVPRGCPGGSTTPPPPGRAYRAADAGRVTASSVLSRKL